MSEQPEKLKLNSAEVNDACWAMLNKTQELGVEVSPDIFNNLKAIFYAGYEKLHELQNKDT